MYRQGDVLIVESAVPIAAKPLAHRIVARGEATGHAHQLGEGAVLFEDQGTLYIKVSREAPLTHEEHETVIIPEGHYRVIRQREWDEEAIRHVRD